MRFLLCFCGLACLHVAHAQQDPMFSQYMLNPYVFNASYGGLDQALSVTAHFRSQWVGISGNPVVQNVSVHSPIPVLHGGAGLQVLNEQEGAMRVTGAYLSYAFIQKTRAGRIAVGISGGVVQGSLDGQKLRSPDGNYDGGIDHQDVLLPNSAVNGVAPDFSAGISFSSTRFMVSVSATHLIPAAISLQGTSTSLDVDLARQYYLQSAYRAAISQSFSLQPSVMGRSNGTIHQLEGDLLLFYKELFWFGGGWRGYNETTQDGVIVLLGLKLGQNLQVGYSYDYSMSALRSSSEGSHEVILNYRVYLMKPAKPGKAIYNPRF